MFIALFVILAFEVGFLLLHNNGPATQQSNTNSASVATNNKLNTLAASFLRYLSYGDTGALTHATFDLEYFGTIVNVYNQPGTIRKIDYQVGLRLQGANGLQYLLFKPSQVKYIKVYAKRLGIEQEIKFSSLKVGDKVTINMTTDVKSTNENLVIKIVKQ